MKVSLLKVLCFLKLWSTGSQISELLFLYQKNELEMVRHRNVFLFLHSCVCEVTKSTGGRCYFLKILILY